LPVSGDGRATNAVLVIPKRNTIKTYILVENGSIWALKTFCVWPVSMTVWHANGYSSSRIPAFNDFSASEVKLEEGLEPKEPD